MTDHCKVIIYSGNFKLLPWPSDRLIDECLTERPRFQNLGVGADKKTAQKDSKLSGYYADTPITIKAEPFIWLTAALINIHEHPI